MRANSVPFRHKGQAYTVYLRKRDLDRGNIEAAQYYFKIDNRPLSTKKTEPEAAIAEAVARLELRALAPGDYEAAVETIKARGGRTVGQLAALWATAGYASPNGVPRTEAQRTRQAAALKTSLPWWRDQIVAAITGPTLSAYADWRRLHCRKNDTGNRVVDLELTTLSNLHAWATAKGHATKNPFEKRPRFQPAGEVSHCHRAMCASDEELHELTGLLINSPEIRYQVAGAQLLFSALTGLRPGEPGMLRWDATWSDGRPQPGCRYQTSDGATLMAVARLKGGINPAIVVHPALAEFLAKWETACRTRWPDSPWMFPDPAAPKLPYVDPEDKRTRLLYALEAATTALKLPHRKPHAMRAYYVRVRRSQGIDDARIALELGQGSGPSIVVHTYGESHGIFGDGRFDWRPAAPVAGAPVPVAAWDLMTAAGPERITRLDGDTQWDTAGDTGKKAKTWGRSVRLRPSPSVTETDSTAKCG
jgi:integrase